MNNNFAFNLKHIRQEKGLTQEQLGKLMNKDYSTIGKWENGTRSPVMEDVVKLADIFNIEIKDLVEKNFYSSDKKSFDDLDILYSKNKDILTEDDKEYIKFIKKKRKKEIDKELNEN